MNMHTVGGGSHGHRHLSPDIGERERGSGRVDLAQIRAGMDVVDTRGTVIGRVKEVRATDFLMDRPFQRDLYVPVGAVYLVHDEALVLNVRSACVDSMEWPSPPLWCRNSLAKSRRFVGAVEKPEEAD